MASNTTTPNLTPAQTLRGKTAIISGSSSGIGLAIARELSSRGSNIVLNYPFPSLSSQAESLISSFPTKTITVCADISTIDGPQTLIDAAVKEFGKIDILVNNAALAVNLPFEEQTLKHWDSLVNLNGRGTFLLTQATLPHLVEQGGRVVNIDSISSRAAPPMQTIYSGTKGMVDSFTRCWAKELPPKYGCTVNAVSPGPTMTEGFAAAGEAFMKEMQPIMDQTPVGKRMARPDEIAFAVGFLCEPRASWINGLNLTASGGLFID
ncbi:short chain type dehydrogenase [Cadophora sp. DSE1049]|nr:short chain type dehydrogenase [Cadophora sp. DSE1049]